MHLTGYSISVWMLMLGLLGLPMSWINPYAALGGWVVIMAGMMWLSLSGPPVAHAYARRVIRGRWSGVAASPWLMVLGVGLCVNTTMACLSGLFRRGGEFVRTPKSGDRLDRKRKRYRQRASPIWLIELSAAAYCGFSFYCFLTVSEAVVGTFLAIFALGFGVVGWQSRPMRAGAAQPVFEAVDRRASDTPVIAPSLRDD